MINSPFEMIFKDGFRTVKKIIWVALGNIGLKKPLSWRVAGIQFVCVHFKKIWMLGTFMNDMGLNNRVCRLIGNKE